MKSSLICQSSYTTMGMKAPSQKSQKLQNSPTPPISQPISQKTASQPQIVPAGRRSHLFRNRYVIVRRLGQGGFGTTYLAEDISAASPMPCVIKQLKYRSKTPMELERNQRRFQREVCMMARLGNHAQLPGLLEHFTDKSKFYLVQEHIPGLTISQEVSRRGVKSEAEVKQFIRDMLPTIRYVHRQNLLHLDIKPSNIIRRSDDNKLVLIDFGAVRRANRADEAAPAKRRRCAGTIGFAPIEQLEGMPTFASDIYALGVTCIYLLTGESPIDLALSPKGQNLRWQESVELSPYFTQVLSKMLHTEVARRFQNTYELERAMNLEPHYETFKDCLTTEAVADKRFTSTACRLVQPVEASSYAQRQALSIREWKQRRRQFKTFVPR